jgi:menaquinone-9 beta-reductase
MAYAHCVATRLSGMCGDAWDAVVIGAGPAGGVAAAVLADRGMRTLIVDRSAFPRAKVCGGCLAPAGVRALRETGLGGALRAAGAEGVTALTMVARGASLRLPIEPYLTVERSRFDGAIVREACARGARFEGGVRAGVLEDDSVVLERGSDRERVRPRVVVVADGLNGSALRGRGGFSWRVDRRSPIGVGAVLDARPEFAADGEISMACGQAGYVGAAPLGGGAWALAAALSARLVSEAGPAGAIERILGESGLGSARLGRGCLRGTDHLTRRRERLARGRVLVVGDAAGYVEPLTGEGMSWAIACAARIGDYGARAAAGEDVSRGWERACAGVLRTRRIVCRGVCALAAHPRALGALLRLGAWGGTGAWASRRLCWRSA